MILLMLLAVCTTLSCVIIHEYSVFRHDVSVLAQGRLGDGGQWWGV